jgi:chromate reductase, NAD(P)H dehydrogenase (quinone)
MTTIVGISGSLRRGSYNSALLRACVERAPAGVSIQVASIREVPLYDGDVETEQGIPEPVRALKQRIAEADGLLLVTPEYNNSLPGVLKNTIDWLSRPPSEIPRIFGGKPVGVIGASRGRFGTVLAQAAWLPVLRTLGAHAWFGQRVLVANSPSVFDAEGRIVDEATQVALDKFVSGFAQFVTNAAKSSGSGSV